MSTPFFSVVIPTYNRSDLVTYAVESVLRQSFTELEVLVSDNGSTDGSQEIAERAGARVVHAPVRGYGGALLNGIDQARGHEKNWGRLEKRCFAGKRVVALLESLPT